MTDLDRRAEEEVTRLVPYRGQTDQDLYVGDLKALAVRLMRYKLAVQEAEREMEGKYRVLEVGDEREDQFFNEGISVCREILSRLTQEQGKE